MLTKSISLFSIILLCYSISTISFASFLSFFYSDAQTAFSQTRLLFASISFILPLVLSAIPEDSIYYVTPQVDVIFSFTPLYCLYYTLRTMLDQQFPLMKNFMDPSKNEVRDNFITTPQFGIFCFLTSCVLSIFGLIFCEYYSSWVMKKEERYMVTQKSINIGSEAGVKLKKENLSNDLPMLQTEKISKVYSDGHEALHEITFEVESGSIFGFIIFIKII